MLNITPTELSTSDAFNINVKKWSVSCGTTFVELFKVQTCLAQLVAVIQTFLVITMNDPIVASQKSAWFEAF